MSSHEDVVSDLLLRRARRPRGDGAAPERRSQVIEETLRLALDASAEAMVVLDVDGCVLHWSRAAERLLGWSEEQVVGCLYPHAVKPGECRGARRGARRVTARTAGGGEAEVMLRAVPLTSREGVARGTALALSVPPVAGETRLSRSPWAATELMRLVADVPEGELCERLRGAIAAGLFLGRLAPGDRLPGIREVARRSGVDHRQVAAAYRRLEAEGTLEVRSRYGASVAARPPACAPPRLETAEWLAGVVAEAAELQVKVPQLAGLVARWAGEATVRCLCVEGTEDGRAALSAEMQGRWGFVTETLPDPATAERGALTAALAAADLVATTPFHLAAVEPAARAAGVPVVALSADAGTVEALEEALRDGDAAVVVADPSYGERLRAVTGGERLRVVHAADEAAVAALDPSVPVLLTRAAQQRSRRQLRLLAPVTPAFSTSCASELAAVLVTCSVRAERTGR